MRIGTFASYFVKTESKKYQKILIPIQHLLKAMVGGSHFKKKKKPLILVFEKEVLITGLIVLLVFVQALEKWLGYKF